MHGVDFYPSIQLANCGVLQCESVESSTQMNDNALIILFNFTQTCNGVPLIS